MYVNGEIDPWHALSVLPGHSPNEKALPTYWVLGASHSYWTQASLPSDGEYDKAAK